MGLTAFRLHERRSAPAAQKAPEQPSLSQRLEAQRLELRELRRENAELRKLLDEVSAPEHVDESPAPAAVPEQHQNESPEQDELRRAFAADRNKHGKRRG